MVKTLIARISNLKQYNASKESVLWRDPKENRWQKIYGLLKENDNVIFIAYDKLLVGQISAITNRKSILCNNIKELTCNNDQFLQLDEVYPELISRVKASFKPFIHSHAVNIKRLIADVTNNRFVSFYVFAGIDNYNQQQSTLKLNDRVIVINDNNTLNNVKKYSKEGLTDFDPSLLIGVSVEGLTLNEILEKNKSIKRKSVKSNNVNRIEQIQAALNEFGFYRFKTFFSYHDALYNKRVYNRTATNGTINIIKIHPSKMIYKVSMGPNAIQDDAFNYFTERNLLVVHGETKAKGTSSRSQGETFINKMNVGDYFYMCRGNNNMEIIGKITSDAVECELEEYGDDGWLQREYKIIAEPIRDDSYKGDRKWWTPNDNSTFIAIPKHEIDDANSKLFVPYFNSRFEYDESETTNSTEENLNKMSSLNEILYGPPGTGKTFKTINKALNIIGKNIKGKTRKEVRKAFEDKVKEGQIVFTTFHQSMSYEDFIEGIKPLPPTKEEGNVIYKVTPGIFKQLANDAWKTKEEKIKVAADSEVLTEEAFRDFYNQFVETLNDVNSEHSSCKLKTKEGYEFKLYRNSGNSISVKSGEEKSKLSVTANELINVHFYEKVPAYKSYEKIIIDKILENKGYSIVDTDNRSKNYVLIIDEINRGNVSQIFGELITLIEDDKRLTKDEALEVILPYSKEKFGVPPNLYIIGTMNTADRSVEALDTALRRRFSFEEVSPQSEVIAKEGKLKESYGVLGNIDLPLLLSIINKRVEKLIDKDHQIGHSYFMSVENLIDLKAVFQNKIIPLLQEYFFGDYGKMGLVIGKGFFEPSAEENEEVFAVFDYDESRLTDKPIYKLKDVNKMTDDEFIQAINLLLRK